MSSSSASSSWRRALSAVLAMACNSSKKSCDWPWKSPMLVRKATTASGPAFFRRVGRIMEQSGRSSHMTQNGGCFWFSYDQQSFGSHCMSYAIHHLLNRQKRSFIPENHGLVSILQSSAVFFAVQSSFLWTLSSLTMRSGRLLSIRPKRKILTTFSFQRPLPTLSDTALSVPARFDAERPRLVGIV